MDQRDLHKQLRSGLYQRDPNFKGGPQAQIRPPPINFNPIQANFQRQPRPQQLQPPINHPPQQLPHQHYVRQAAPQQQNAAIQQQQAPPSLLGQGGGGGFDPIFNSAMRASLPQPLPPRAVHPPDVQFPGSDVKLEAPPPDQIIPPHPESTKPKDINVVEQRIKNLQSKLSELSENQKRVHMDLKEKFFKRIIRIIDDEQTSERLIFKPFHLGRLKREFQAERSQKNNQENSSSMMLDQSDQGGRRVEYSNRSQSDIPMNQAVNFQVPEEDQSMEHVYEQYVKEESGSHSIKIDQKQHNFAQPQHQRLGGQHQQQVFGSQMKADQGYFRVQQHQNSNFNEQIPSKKTHSNNWPSSSAASYKQATSNIDNFAQMASHGIAAADDDNGMLDDGLSEKKLKRQLLREQEQQNSFQSHNSSTYSRGGGRGSGGNGQSFGRGANRRDYDDDSDERPQQRGGGGNQSYGRGQRGGGAHPKYNRRRDY